jgi:hypothetical protein
MGSALLHHRGLRTGRAVVAAAIAVLLALGVFAAPAAGQAAPADPCPAAVPVSQVTAGLTGTGYTVSSGTTPEPSRPGSSACSLTASRPVST